ncbi:unnamed protein product, partial [Adineta steineri]
MAHLHLRRSRTLQCDRTDRSGEAIVFGIGLNYPSSLPCQNLSCQIDLYIGIHQKFNTVTDRCMSAVHAVLSSKLTRLELVFDDHKSNLSFILHCRY